MPLSRKKIIDDVKKKVSNLQVWNFIISSNFKEPNNICIFAKMCVLLFLFLYSIPSSSNANGIHLDFFFWPVRLTEEKLLFVGDRSKGFSFCQKRFFHTIPVAELDMYLVSTTHNMIVVGTYLPYMYFFFLGKTQKIHYK